MKTTRHPAAPGTALACAMACVFLLTMNACALAQQSIAVLAFETHNLTPIADTAEDVQHAASISRMLEQALQDTLDLRIVTIDPAVVREADAAFGYLFEHADVTAELGRTHGVDWVVVGRVHKPSFLFSYLMARLVDTQTNKVSEDLIVEIKGQKRIVTRKGAERLAEKLAVRLRAEARGASNASPER